MPVTSVALILYLQATRQGPEPDVSLILYLQATRHGSVPTFSALELADSKADG